MLKVLYNIDIGKAFYFDSLIEINWIRRTKYFERQT